MINSLSLAADNHHDRIMLISPFSHMGEIKKEKRIMNQHELPGRTECRTFLELRQQAGINLSEHPLSLYCGKKDDPEAERQVMKFSMTVISTCSARS